MNRDLLRLLGDTLRARPLPVVALAGLGLVANARVGIYTAAMGAITQALVDRDRQSAVTWMAIFLAASLIEQLYWPLREHLQSIITDSATHRIQGRVLRRAAAAPLVAFEDGPFFERLQRATDDLGSRIAGIFQSGIDVLQVALMMMSMLVPVWLIDPRLVIVLVLGMVPGFFAQYRTARLVHEARLRHATGDRLLERLGRILTDRDSAAELRLFGNGGDLVRRWRETRRGRGEDVIAAERRKMTSSLLGETSAGAGVAVALALTVSLLLDGQAPLGAWVTMLVTIEFLLSMVYGLAMTLRGVRENGAFLGDLFAFEAEADAIIAREQQNRLSMHDDSRHRAGAAGRSTGPMRIVAENVTFAYPGSDRAVVRDVSLTLEPGERVAIVGENGAGKSTLVRLLTGLYAPNAGSVTQDGLDAGSDTALELRPAIGAVFQDYVPWQMPARDNIGMSDLARLDDDVALREAAAKAGVLDLIDALPDGLDTWLGREFGERDLSGGQWQRVALARAFFRDARFLVMDEPTAALDPLAEQRLFERFSALAAGRTALTISHRLGPARFADRVVVMDAGRIVECGHHDELMARDGRYAAMFRAQAAWYRDEAVDSLPKSAP